MPDDLFKAIASITDRLISLASEDAQLRSHLRQVAQAILRATETPEADGDSSPAEAETTIAVKVVDSASVVSDSDPAIAPHRESLRGTDPSAEPRAPLPELRLGQSVTTAEPPERSLPIRETSTPVADLSLIEARCRLKAEGARWAVTRRRLIAEGAAFSTEIDPVDRDIISRAKAIPDCFLWMCHANGPSPPDLRQYEQVAHCFEAVADILAGLNQIQNEQDQHRSHFEKLLDLLAEAQSALRVAIAEIDGPIDPDQLLVFSWLKATASESQTFIQRYMRVDDPADPSQWADLSARIEAVDTAIQETRRRSKQRRKLLDKVRHKLSLIANDPVGNVDQWLLLASTVDELVADGLPPSNRQLRELLVPAIDDLPELSNVPRGFQLVLREIDRFMATCTPAEATFAVQPTPAVQEVARLLEGRSIMLIGGDRRPGSQQALKDSFRLRELIWIETREHQSIEGFEPYVARPDVAVVALAIRWSSHSFGDVRDICERHEKPLVRLPGGYSPNQVAAQILAQCSGRIRRE